MGLSNGARYEIVQDPLLVFIPTAANGSSPRAFAGQVGAGYAAVLCWRFALRVPGEIGTWVGLVGAHTGAIVAFYDEDQHAQAKAGVYPESNDQTCPDGCEQPGYPMPFADLTIDGRASVADSIA